MVAYYNEFDPFAAAWLRELIKKGLIADGDVDERSITDVRPEELEKYTQCHFFAGIGGWSYALRLSGWPDERPVWTGSCPCQPFSTAGSRKGKQDERHLWPTWFNLISKCRPPTIFGEQVASAITYGWLDDVYQGMEAEGYAVGSAILPACSVGAPHKRDRLFFVADTTRVYAQGCKNRQGEKQFGRNDAQHSSMGNAEHDGLFAGAFQGSNGQAISDSTQGKDCTSKFARTGKSSNVANAVNTRPQGHWEPGKNTVQEGWQGTQRYRWQSGVWIDCPDGKQRLIEPSIPLLANGVSNRVGKLRGYGNAIVPQVAAEFIASYMQCHGTLL